MSAAQSSSESGITGNTTGDAVSGGLKPIWIVALVLGVAALFALPKILKRKK